jgi:putative ABC transport system ATP-binding protein
MSAVLDARDLYRFYHTGDDETLALRGVSLAVDAASLSRLRPAGLGKSTPPTAPRFSTSRTADYPDRVGSRRSERKADAAPCRSIGMLFQSVN